MENSLYIALSRQSVVDRQMEVIANNLANATTPAFKGETMMFAEHLARAPGQAPLSFVRDVASLRDMQEGSFTRTENPLDLAIHGDGWFAVGTQQGEQYTRNGHFALDALGRLVTSQGQPILSDTSTPITFQSSDTNITVAGDGTVLADGQPRAKLRIVTFDNQQQLKYAGNTLYVADPKATATKAGSAQVVQGMLEDSNVKPILEITAMMTALRMYQGAQKLIDTEHDRQLKAIDTLTKS